MRSGHPSPPPPPATRALPRRRFLGTLAAFAALAPSLPSTAATDATPPTSSRLARRILDDQELVQVLERARTLLRTGLNAGDGYGEVWIRDLNTFLELALQVNPAPALREALLTFLRFQGDDGNIVDGFIPEAKAGIGYRYRRSPLAPGQLAHKNTVETDQESSLVQAVARYVRVTGDDTVLLEPIGDVPTLDRLERALDYLMQDRWSPDHDLLWGATTVDWGDVQPEHPWGVELDEHSHRAIDIYDNALFLVAIREFLSLPHVRPPAVARWTDISHRVRAGIRRHLWDAPRGKFMPHVYLDGSPFPPDFDEDAIWYHGGTAVAMEADLLTRDEIVRSLAAMRDNVRRAGAASLGLTVYPPYPDGFFQNPGMGAWSYQNGGDWCWFGGRLIRQLLRAGLVEDACRELKPMISRVLRHGGFFEWWTRDNQPRGSGQFRGSAGVLGIVIQELRAWAAAQSD